MYLLDDDTKHGTALVMLGEGRVFENSFHKATMRVVTLEPGESIASSTLSINDSIAVQKRHSKAKLAHRGSAHLISLIAILLTQGGAT